MMQGFVDIFVVVSKLKLLYITYVEILFALARQCFMRTLNITKLNCSVSMNS